MHVSDTSKPPPSQTSITAYLMSHTPLESDVDVDDHLLRYQPVLHTREADAIDQAHMAAPSEESPEERAALLAPAHGSIPGVSPSTDLPPEHVSYITKLRLHDVRIETTDATDRRTHLLYRAAKPPPEALWLPSALAEPLGHQLRIIASESLLNRFEFISSTRISARSRPPRWP